MTYPEIPVAIMNEADNPDYTGLSPGGYPWIASGRSFIAICIANPKIRASGVTEEDAVKSLKALLRSYYTNGKRRVKYATISFRDEFVEEVMTE